MVTIEALNQFFRDEIPQVDFVIESIAPRAATLRKHITEQHLRPGGTVSGPVMMEMCDAALYVAILATVGIKALAVTTNLNINFLRKPVADADIIAECRLIKVGKRQVVGEISIYSDGNPEPVAHAVGTYALPQ